MKLLLAALLLAAPVNAVAQEEGSNWHIGGNTEVVVSSEIDVPGVAVTYDNHLSDEWTLGVEVGVDCEGRFSLDQLNVTHHISPALNVRAGRVIVPMGLRNAYDEPDRYFRNTDAQYDVTDVPYTWYENGVEVYGCLGKGYASFDYCAQMVTGCFGNRNLRSAGYLLRLDYVGVPGLRVGGSVYRCADADEGKVDVFNIDGRYENSWIETRADLCYGSYWAEVGLKIAGLVAGRNFPDIIPFVRYEKYNPQELTLVGDAVEERHEMSLWSVGIDWRALPGLSVKADYSSRRISKETVSRVSRFAIGMALVW